jgi:SAM-dependent methyltransferase
VNQPDRDDWDSHWEDYGDSASDNPAQDYRRQVIIDLLGLRGSGAGVRLLDIGSGQGDMAAVIHAIFPAAEILGLELSQSGVEISRRKVPGARFFHCNLLEQTTAPDEQRNWATYAVCSEVIEHVDDPVQLLRSAREYMHPDCVLVLTAPGGPMSTFDKHIGHRKHYRPDAIEELLRQAGYVPEYAGKAGFPFFNLYRCVVILRGKKLVEDVSAQKNPSSSRLARAVMATFHTLFRMNLQSSPWGWQLIAKARLPAISGHD